MTLSVNTNVSSLIAQYQLNKTENSLQTSIQRLSSGLRINSAADDASGYAISNRMTSIIGGLATSIRNANDGISYSQTVTSALSSLNTNFQRMRELAVQSLNGDVSNADRALLSQEYNQLIAENTRIQATTTYNGIAVFSNSNTSIQVGYQNNFQDRVSLNTLPLTNSTAVSSTSITETPTTTAAQDIGAVITQAYTATDGSGNSTATYDNVRDAVVSALGSEDKLTVSQQNELINIVNNLHDTDVSIHAGVNNFGSQLNQLMGSSLSGATLNPTSPVNASISGSSLSAINSIPSISTSISNVLTNASGAANVTSAYTTIQGILNNPYITGAGNTAISTAITALYNQYQYSSNVSGFVSSVQNVLLGSHSSTPSISASDGLSGGSRATEQADTWFTTTMPSVMSNGSNNTISTLQTALVNSINSSSLNSSTKTAITSAINIFSGLANAINLSFSSYKTFLQNLINSGSTSTGSTVTLSAAGISAINSTPSTLPSTLIANAINGASSTYSSVYSAATAVVNNLASSGIISSSIQSDLNNGITTLYNESSNANTLVSQFKADLNTLVGSGTGSGAIGSVGPFTTTNTYKTTGGTFAQLQIIPTGVTSSVNATNAINTIDSALTEINTASAQQGAFQNRLAAIINDLQSFSLSQTSAQSRIQDVDFAKETTNLAKSQILETSGSAMLAQANSSPQSVIALLQTNVPSDTIQGNSLLPDLSTSVGPQSNLMSTSLNNG